MAGETQCDLPTLVSSLQAATVDWSLPAQRPTNSGMTGVGVSSIGSAGRDGVVSVRVGCRYLRYAQVLQDIDELFADLGVRTSAELVAWWASLKQSGVASNFGALIVDHVLQGMLPYVTLQRCLRLMDIFLGWVTRPNAGRTELGIGSAGPSCPVLVPSYVLMEWIERTWAIVTTLSRDNAGTASPTSAASLCSALQLLPILLRWNSAGSPLPPFRRAQLPHPTKMLSLAARLLALQVLPPLLLHQPGALRNQTCAYEMIEYVKRACAKTVDLSLRIAVGSSLRGLLEAGLRVSSPAVAYTLIDMLLTLCDEASLHGVADDNLRDVGVSMGYLLAFYQCDFTTDVLADVLQASFTSTLKPAGEERLGHRGACGGSSGRVRWQFFGGSDAVEGSRMVQRSFNERMTRAAQRALATALATLCSCCVTPATTADAIQCCFVLLVPFAEDGRAYMPRLLTEAILEWATQLPSNGHRVVLADALRGYVQRCDEDKAVARTAMVALQGVVRTLTSSLEIGFNVAKDVLAAVQSTPSLLHAGVEVLGAVARTNVLYARHLQHQCARVGSADAANTLTFQLHLRALLGAAGSLRAGPALQGDALGDEDRTSLVHVCIRLLLRLSRGHPPRTVQDVHYRQAELIFRITQLLYNLLQGSSAAVLETIRDEVQPCTVGFMNLLVSSPGPTIAYYKAVTAACAMLRRAPTISDMERMLAVGFLEARLASQYNGAKQDASAVASSAEMAYFAISRASLFELVSSRPWPTCKDDGSLRWLAAQALKDVATACAQGVPVFSFADTCDEAIASAAELMGLLRADLRPQPASEVLCGASLAAVEIPTHPVEECGGHAVRLLRWTLRHFVQRDGATSVCAALLTSLRTELYEAFGTPVVVAAAESEDVAQQILQQDVALWNCLCTVEQLLQEASPPTAAALRQNVEWGAEVKRWQLLAAQLVSDVGRARVEVRLLAAKILGRCLVLTDQVDLYTSQTMSAVAHGLVGKSVQPDALGALMVLSEAHSCYKECRAAAVESAGTDSDSSPTLPLATSLLAEAWKQLAGSASTAITSAVVSAPLLLLISLRLVRAYPVEVEAALLDNVVAVLLTPMTAANRLWWSPESMLGVLTALQQLWAAFPCKSACASAVPHGTALLLLQQSHATALQGQRAPASTVAAAALDAVHTYTVGQQCDGEQAALAGTHDRRNSWNALLRQCLDYITLIPPEEVGAASRTTVRVRGQGTALRRRVTVDDGLSRRLAVFWRLAMEGVTSTAPSVARGSARLLGPVEVAVQVDVAIAAATRREWVSAAQATYTLLLSQRSASAALQANRHDVSLKMYLDGIHAVLQARSPDVQISLAKRDTDVFETVEDADVADTARGGGSDSEGAKEYAEEYGEEGMGGILSEAGGSGGADEERGPVTSDLGTGVVRSDAASLNFDVAAKEAAMWWLYGVLRSLQSPSSSVDSRENDDGARQALLPVVVAAAQLVEVHPEVQMSTIAVLREVLVAWGDATQWQSDSRQTPALLQWKTQLVVGLTTVLQHGLVSLEGCTALAVQFSRCNMADPSSCRRVLRSLLLLLHTCHRLRERGRGFLLIGGSGAGHIIVALSKVAESPAMKPSGGDSTGGGAADAAAAEQTQRGILRSLTSAPCQAALTLLCELFVTAASLANGYVQSADTIGLPWGGGGGCRDDDDDDGASTASSVYVSRTSVSAGDVLQAVALLTQEPLKAVLGPALRYASGCLTVLVLTTLAARVTPPPLPDRGPSDSVAALTSVAVLSSQLTANHQRLLAQVAQERLCARIEKHLSSAQSLQSVWGTTETGLLRIVTAAPVSRDTAATLLERIKPILSQPAAGGWRAEVAASLLVVGMGASLDLNWLRPLLAALPVKSLLSDVPQEVLARLHHAVRSYLCEGGPTRVRALALVSPAGLLLVEQCAPSDNSSAECYPLLAHREIWPVALQLLWEAHDPLHVVTVMWSGAPSQAHATPPSSLPLREQVPLRRLQAEVLLSLLASLCASSGSSVDVDEAAVLVLLRCGRLMSELLLGIMASEGVAAAPDTDALYTVLAYVAAVLCTPLGAAFAVALKPVGLHLMRAVALSAGPALREAIQRLGSTQAAQLRSFMEGSCS